MSHLFDAPNENRPYNKKLIIKLSARVDSNFVGSFFIIKNAKWDFNTPKGSTIFEIYNAALSI